MNTSQTERVTHALGALHIELPSWGFANTGTRFGKYLQPAAALTIDEKFADAAEVHRLTGACPTLALHVLWDLPHGADDVRRVMTLASEHGIRPGSINPNLFEDQEYKFGSFGNPDAAVRAAALRHTRDSVDIAKALGSRDVVLWFADGSNYPGSANIRQRKRWFEENLQALHADVDADQRLLIEYKPFEPAFYHTDIADWGMALTFARAAGPHARVLVDTGHHYQSQNIEQIVAWLLAEGMLGGFHFNDRRYADDDLTLGSIDPYQVFRIFHEILFFEWETGTPRRHRLHDRSEPQPQGQDRGDDSDRRARAGAVREGCARRLPQTRLSAESLRHRRRGIGPARCVRDRRAAGDRGMAAGEAAACRSAGGVSRRRLRRAHHRPARRTDFSVIVVRVADILN